MHLQFQVERLDGFAGDVMVSCDQLPPGIECRPVTVTSAQSSADLVFFAREDAPPGKGIVKVSGKAAIGEQQVVHEAIHTCVTWETGNKGQVPAYYRRTRDLEISVMPHETAAVTVQAGDGKVLETSLGGKIQLPVKLVRRHNYVEPLKLTARSLPGQLKPGDLTIAKDKNDGTIEVFVKDKNTRPGSYSFCLKGDAKFKYSRNPEAASREDAEFQRLQALFKKTSDEKKSLAVEMAAAEKKLPELEKMVVAAKTAVATAAKESSQVASKIKSLEASLAKSRKSGSVDPLILEAAESNLAELKKNLASNEKMKLAQAELAAREKEKVDAVASVNEQKTKIKHLWK